MPPRGRSRRRSSCPINAFVEIFGDRWSLLIVRDLMLRGYTTYKQLLSGDEGIATNILGERLAKLVEAGIVEREPDQMDGRKLRYRLTSKGIDLAPVIAAAAGWSFRHEPHRAPPHLAALIGKGVTSFAADVRVRWEARSTDPLLPSPEPTLSRAPQRATPHARSGRTQSSPPQRRPRKS